MTADFVDPGTQARMVVSPYLRPGERLLWAGRPDPSVNFAPIDLFLVPFSLLWAGFAVFWEVSAVSMGAPLFFALFGLAFVAVGAYFVVGRFFVKRYRKRQTSYGITDHRALAVVGGTVTDTPVYGVATTVRRSRSGAHVTVVFGAPQGSGFMSTAYVNTGMDLFAGGRNAPAMAIVDVADPDRLVAALNEAARPR